MLHVCDSRSLSFHGSTTDSDLMRVYSESVEVFFLEMRPPTFWNVHFLLGIFYFLLNPLLSSTDSSSFIRNKNNYPPTFVQIRTNITVKEGDLANLPCFVKNIGTRQVAWRRLFDGQIMTVGTLTWVKDKRVTIEHKIRHETHGVTEWNLLIKNVKEDDSGVYECQLTDKKKNSMNITLKVKARSSKPRIVISGNKYPNLGQEIKLKCNASGGGSLIPEEIDWFKEGDKIDVAKYPHILITKFRELREKSLVSELIIDHSKVTDSGMYICRSSDEEIDSIKVTVMVAGSVNKKRGTGSGTADSSRVSMASALSGRHPVWMVCFAVLLYPFFTHVI